MIRWNRVAVAAGCAIILTAVVFALTPVTIQPSSILPGVVRDLLPPAAQTAEVSCGSVLNPHDPPGFDGVLATVASAVNTDCTRAVRSRMWFSIWVFLAGATIVLVGWIALRQRGGPPRRAPRHTAEGDGEGQGDRSQPGERVSRRAGVATVAALLVVGTVGCSSSPERSTEAFCSTMKSEQARILAQFNATVDAGKASNDGMTQALMGLGASIQALGELRTYFHKLSDVAPEEIRTEAEIVAQGYDDQLKAAKDAVSDPLGALASTLFEGMMMSGQLDTLNQFAVRECGQSI